MQQNVVEIVKFKLALGATESDIMDVNPAFTEWVEQQPGLLYRSLTKDSQTGEYLDIIYWQSMEHAKAVSAQFPKTEVCQRLTQYIDSESVTISHSNVLSQTPCSG
ncbi:MULTISPECIES: hypothetical protein [Pseudoalteromonas]|uniref:hypothetical protein n=1 Tax=Pseudoalteromonas TaxID=53246 RepID=UPI001EFD5448|nr:hypothetical protein [Pseudoalteromonas sp. Isolate6]MCG9757625.1 hypothetical protein [Pseudoalteromonas sp. Isolate6]